MCPAGKIFTRRLGGGKYFLQPRGPLCPAGKIFTRRLGGSTNNCPAGPGLTRTAKNILRLPRVPDQPKRGVATALRHVCLCALQNVFCRPTTARVSRVAATAPARTRRHLQARGHAVLGSLVVALVNTGNGSTADILRRTAKCIFRLPRVPDIFRVAALPPRSAGEVLCLRMSAV